eukprot:5848778-Heterocapsa_arctica.AAC.1
MSQWPDFRKASHNMDEEWQDDYTNLQTDNTVGYLIYAATGMRPHEDLFLEEHHGAEAGQADDEPSSDDNLTGDKPIRSATGQFSLSPEYKRNSQATRPPEEGKADNRREHRTR